MRQLSQMVILLVLLSLNACASEPVAEVEQPFLDKALKIYTYGKQKASTMVQLRKDYGQGLEQHLAPYFAATEYKGDGLEPVPAQAQLKITFLYLLKRESDQAFEVKAHYLLRSQEKVLRNEVYNVKHVTRPSMTACLACSEEHMALKKLTEKALPDIQQALLK